MSYHQGWFAMMEQNVNQIGYRLMGWKLIDFGAATVLPLNPT